MQTLTFVPVRAKALAPVLPLRAAVREQARGQVQPPAIAAMSSLRVLLAARMRGRQPK